MPEEEKDIPCKKTILYVLTGAKCWTRKYIDSLEDKDKSKLLALLNRIVDNGPPRNKEKFRLLEDGIFEIKSYQDRLLCFYDKNKRNSLVITHGVKKKTQKLSRDEIERAKNLRKEYYREE
ncbi:MAG: type II toxin-antitoxin system RelE/ParE family toxin [Nitrospinae bacterium]|nr:type II toxin-antitoxin system RelE/ParE family toxin [Nitrospinota bacterium]